MKLQVCLVNNSQVEQRRVVRTLTDVHDCCAASTWAFSKSALISPMLSCTKMGFFHHRHVQTISYANFVVREPMLSEFVPNAGQLRLDILVRRGTQAYALDITHTAGSADVAEETKRSKYSSLCNAMGLPFHPVAFSLAGMRAHSRRYFLISCLSRCLPLS